jgi:hypothetical protein
MFFLKLRDKNKTPYSKSWVFGMVEKTVCITCGSKSNGNHGMWSGEHKLIFPDKRWGLGVGGEPWRLSSEQPGLGAFHIVRKSHGMYSFMNVHHLFRFICHEFAEYNMLRICRVQYVTNLQSTICYEFAEYNMLRICKTYDVLRILARWLTLPLVC